MSRPAPDHKHYPSARKRFLHESVASFFEEHFPRFFGPVIRERIAHDLLARIEAQVLPSAHLRPGQCLWNAVSRDTRADSPHLRLVPVVLTLVDEEDISLLSAGAPLTQVKSRAVARVLEEAYQQGALLSMRDVGLLTWQRWNGVGLSRRAWESEHGRQLPHTGNLQDMGSCLTHKATIVAKVVYEHQDPRRVAAQTRHSQQAVDRYVKDFHRVRTCYRQRPDLDFISQVSGLSKHLVHQYLDLIEIHEPALLTGTSA
jgi:hypothetical protein